MYYFWTIVEWVIKLLIIGCFTYHVVILYTKARSLSRILISETGFFENEVDRSNIVERFPLIEQRMEEKEILGQAWRDFDASLVKSGSSVSTTVESDAYFNEYVLVDVPLKLEVMRNIPGILTSMGIIGTFIGVLAGLNGYDSQNVEAVRSSVSNLLLGVHNAFENSLLAISLAVVFTVFEKYYVNTLYSKVTRLQQAINRVFNRSISEDYLQKMLVQSEEQSQALKSFSQDLSESIKVALDELVSKQTKIIVSSSEEYAKTISKTLNAQLRPPMEKLNSVMDEVRVTQANASQEAMQKMVTDFSNSLQGSSNRQLEQMLQAISGTAEILGSMKMELGGFITTIKQQSEVQNQIVTKQIETLSSYASSSQTEMQQEFRGFIKNISETLSQLQSNLAIQSTNSINSMSTQIASTVNDTVLKMGNEAEKLLVANVEVNRELMSRVDKLVIQMDNLSNKTSNATEDLTEKLRQGTSSMAKLLGQTDDLSKSFVDILQKNGEIVKVTSSSVGDLQTASREIALSTNSYSQIQQTVASYITTFNQQIQKSEEKYAQLTALFNSFSQSMDQVERTVVENEAVVQSLNETINEGLSNYVTLTQQSISGYLAELDKSLATTINSLNNATGGLEDSLEEFSDNVDRMLKTRVG